MQFRLRGGTMVTSGFSFGPHWVRQVIDIPSLHECQPLCNADDRFSSSSTSTQHEHRPSFPPIRASPHRTRNERPISGSAVRCPHGGPHREVEPKTQIQRNPCLPVRHSSHLSRLPSACRSYSPRRRRLLHTTRERAPAVLISAGFD